MSNRAPVLTEDTAGAGAPLEPGSLTASATPGYWKINALGLLISLSNLLDVLLTAPATGNFLQYNGTKWVNNSVLTSGRVTYATTNGVLADSANHTWNNASGYLGVGNGVAAYPLDVYKTTGIVQSRTRTDDTTQYAQTLIQAGTSGIALAAFGTAWPASGVYGPGTAAFQSAAATGIFIVNESGEVHIVTHGFAAANKRFTFGSTANTSLEPLWIPGAGSNPTTTLGEGGAGNLLTNAYNDGTWRRIAITATPVGMFLNPNGAALADVAWYKSTAGAAGSAITWTRLMELVGATGVLQIDSLTASRPVYTDASKGLTTTPQGSFVAIVTKVFADSPYTVVSTNEVVLCDTTNGAITVNLPAAASNTGRRLIVKKIDSALNNVTIDASGAELIDGVTTQTLTTQWASLTLVSNGSAWYIT